MALIKWHPFFDPFEDFDRSFFGDALPMVTQRGFTPALDLYQTKDSVVVEMPLSGIDPDKVNVNIENNVLTVSGSTEKKSEVDEKDYYRKEVRQGSFYRSTSLPTRVSGDKALASYENGILRITVPKASEAKPTSIKVKKGD